MRQEEIITLPNLVKQYLNYLSGVKSKSMLTVLEYGSDLRLFFRYISKSRGLADKHTPFDEINIFEYDLDTGEELLEKYCAECWKTRTHCAYRTYG